jgi:hypothetical protein
MGPALVVVIDELVDEGLELVDGGGLLWLGSQPFLHGLLEPFDLPQVVGVHQFGW